MPAIHNSWRNFEEPDRFLPERWLAPGADYARSLKGGELACTSGELKLVTSVLQTGANRHLIMQRTGSVEKIVWLCLVVPQAR